MTFFREDITKEEVDRLVVYYSDLLHKNNKRSFEESCEFWEDISSSPAEYLSWVLKDINGRGLPYYESTT